MKKERRAKRVRGKILAQKVRPRLSVFRSSKHIYGQIIDDMEGKTLLAVSEKEIGEAKGPGKIEQAKKVGAILAQKALKLKIKEVVFDRGPFLYHGRVKALAESARKGGLDF